MKGPFEIGTFGDFDPRRRSQLEPEGLTRAEYYRVIKPFTDADGDVHPVGEKWLFLRSDYIPYDGIRTLYVRMDSGHEWSIALRDQEAEQNKVYYPKHGYLELTDESKPRRILGDAPRNIRI